MNIYVQELYTGIFVHLGKHTHNDLDVKKSCRCSSDAFQTSSACAHYSVAPGLMLSLLTDLSHLASLLFLKCPSNTNLHWKRRAKRRSKCTLCTSTTSKVYTPPDNSKIHGHLVLKYRHFRLHHLAPGWKVERRDNEAKCEMCSGNQTPHSRQAGVHWGQNVLALAATTDIWSSHPAGVYPGLVCHVLSKVEKVLISVHQIKYF